MGATLNELDIFPYLTSIIFLLPWLLLWDILSSSQAIQIAFSAYGLTKGFWGQRSSYRRWSLIFLLFSSHTGSLSLIPGANTGYPIFCIPYLNANISSCLLRRSVRSLGPCNVYYPILIIRLWPHTHRLILGCLIKGKRTYSSYSWKIRRQNIFLCPQALHL